MKFETQNKISVCVKQKYDTHIDKQSFSNNLNSKNYEDILNQKLSVPSKVDQIRPNYDIVSIESNAQETVVRNKVKVNDIAKNIIHETVPQTSCLPMYLFVGHMSKSRLKLFWDFLRTHDRKSTESDPMWPKIIRERPKTIANRQNVIAENWFESDQKWPQIDRKWQENDWKSLEIDRKWPEYGCKMISTWSEQKSTGCGMKSTESDRQKMIEIYPETIKNRHQKFTKSYWLDVTGNRLQWQKNTGSNKKFTGSHRKTTKKTVNVQDVIGNWPEAS